MVVAVQADCVLDPFLNLCTFFTAPGDPDLNGDHVLLPPKAEPIDPLVKGAGAAYIGQDQILPNPVHKVHLELDHKASSADIAGILPNRLHALLEQVEVEPRGQFARPF